MGELGRAGFQDYIDVYTQTRLLSSSTPHDGEDLVNTGLQMLMLPPVQNVVALHSFCSHLVAYIDDQIRTRILKSLKTVRWIPSPKEAGSTGGSSAIG
jgi:hypothetical protein